VRPWERSCITEGTETPTEGTEAKLRLVFIVPPLAARRTVQAKPGPSVALFCGLRDSGLRGFSISDARH
jgi:hypothetical protein